MLKMGTKLRTNLAETAGIVGTGLAVTGVALAGIWSLELLVAFKSFTAMGAANLIGGAVAATVGVKLASIGKDMKETLQTEKQEVTADPAPAIPQNSKVMKPVAKTFNHAQKPQSKISAQKTANMAKKQSPKFKK